MRTSIWICMALVAVATLTFGQPFTPTIVSTTIVQPVGIAADTTRVLVTAPYCDGGGSSARGVYDVTSGTATVFKLFSLPAGWNSCAESYIVISNGLGGFPAGNVYVTSGNLVLQITPGGTMTTFATLNISSSVNPDIPITIDRVGSWGNRLIVTALSGSAGNPPTVFLIDNTGAVTSFTVPASAGHGVQLEGPEVAPLTFGAFGGFLMVGQEAGSVNGRLYAISPADHSLHLMPVLPPNPRPENMKFFAAQSCSIGVPGGGGVSNYIQVLYQNSGPGALAYFNGALPVNQMALALEQPGGSANAITLIIDQTGNSVGNYASFFHNPDQQEGDTTVLCPLASHCTLTQGGYKNHFNNLVLNFPLGGLTLGTVFYTNVQLNAILQDNAIHGNGLLSLAHQLITAELNIFYGSIPPANVSAAIVTANSLIGSLVIPPIGTGYLNPSVESTTETTLDNFNNSNDCR